QEGDQLIFLHSDTTEGELCATVLGRYYEQKGYQTTVEVIPHLSYREAHFRSRGLRSLVGKLVKIIEDERNRWGQSAEIIINATGGFKAEGAYATLVGLLFNVPVYYIHEVFQEIVKMPVVLVRWDYSVVAEYEELLHFISQDLRSRQEVKKIFPTIPEAVSALLEEEENCVLLSPAGEVVFRAYQEKLREFSSMPVFLSSEARRWFEKADETVKEEMRRIIRKLKLPEVRHYGAEAIKRSPCFVYPRRHKNERVIFCEHDGALRICAFARHSDRSYEMLLERKIRCEGKEQFIPFVER
ncbi:MAG: putative CRISPR-associated protein, partial [bacterium]